VSWLRSAGQILRLVVRALVSFTLGLAASMGIGEMTDPVHGWMMNVVVGLVGLVATLAVTVGVYNLLDQWYSLRCTRRGDVRVADRGVVAEGPPDGGVPTC